MAASRAGGRVTALPATAASRGPRFGLLSDNLLTVVHEPTAFSRFFQP